MRSLSPDEEELWGRVTATIRPLSRQPRSSPPAGRSQDAVLAEGVGTRARRPLHHSPTASSPAPRGAEELGRATLDGSWDKTLRSGSVRPDRIVDLHGMNLDAAWAAIDHNIEEAIGRGERVVLLITGHHRPRDAPVQRGRIRHAVHDWLAASRHAPHIAAVRGAHRRHGGGGSLYLILRRKPRGR